MKNESWRSLPTYTITHGKSCQRIQHININILLANRKPKGILSWRC